MKKLFVVLLGLTLIAISCSKDSDFCKCGEIMETGITSDMRYWVKIKNRCSQNTKMFFVDQSEWGQATVGMTGCMDNEKAW